MNVFSATNEETLAFLQENSFKIYTTFMDETAEDLYKKTSMKNLHYFFGTEHSGLSDFWLHKGKNILIPMSGTIDSLNLSNAVAISCYEILRQNSLNKKTASFSRGGFCLLINFLIIFHSFFFFSWRLLSLFSCIFYSIFCFSRSIF